MAVKLSKQELENIKNYPIHWHNTIEIVFVLEGSVSVIINSGNYKIYARELEIINCNEAHTIYSDDNNKALIFHLDPVFFDKYYDDMKNIYFYIILKIIMN